MQFLRIRIPESAYKEVEKNGDLTIVRWSPEKELVTIPPRKKGGEPTVKESGYLICTERVYHGNITQEDVNADVAKDAAIRGVEIVPPTL